MRTNLIQRRRRPCERSRDGSGVLATGLRQGGCALAILLLAARPAGSSTLRVDPSGGGDHTTIQAALTAAATGDTVLVAPAVYTGAANRDLDFGGKGITLLSEGGRDVTAIDCERAGRGFYFHSGETSAALVAGFTVRNGESTDRGGGICCEGASPRLEDCAVVGCVTGAGSVTGYGGGVFGSNSAVALTSCMLSGNSADEGAAMYTMDSSPTLTGCRLVANQAVKGGGGIRILRGGSGAHLTGCTIAGNTAVTYGGGVYCCYSQPVITGCTITGNAASNGGAIYGYDASPTITNTILAFSTTGAAVYCPGAGTFTVTYCCSYGNAGGDSLCGTTHDNVFADPAFCDTTAGSFGVQECSPCIGAGAGGADIGAWGAGCPCGTSVVPEAPAGARVALTAAPNPARGRTELAIEGAGPPLRGAEPAVTIHDLRGRFVRELRGELSADGVWRATWDGADSGGSPVPSGVYFARTRGGAAAEKVVVLR